MPKITDLFTLVRLLIEDRKRLMLQNLALRQQLADLKRYVTRPKIDDSDRVFQIRSAPRSPWQNCFVERVIGSIRLDCTDHVIALGERHLLRLLREYVAYYNESRCHMSLDGNSPVACAIEDTGKIIARPVLGGLHHRYGRPAA